MIHINPHKTVMLYENLVPADITIKDIAKNLSLQCRYNGACQQFYSVAEHCVILADMFDDAFHRQVALLHDAHEAYMGDIIRPVQTFFKDSLNLWNLTDRLDRSIWKKFHLERSMKKATLAKIKEMDNLLLQVERYTNSYPYLK